MLTKTCTVYLKRENQFYHNLFYIYIYIYICVCVCVYVYKYNIFVCNLEIIKKYWLLVIILKE